MDREHIQMLVDTHVGMYLGGLSGNRAASTSQSNTEEKVDPVTENLL